MSPIEHIIYHVIIAFVILFLQGLGFIAHVGYKIKAIDLKHPELNWKQVKDMYVEDNWSTFIGSFVVLLANQAFHLIVAFFFPDIMDGFLTVPFTTISMPYLAVLFICCPFLGWFGQEIMYSIFGKSKEYIDKKIEELTK